MSKWEQSLVWTSSLWNVLFLCFVQYVDFCINWLDNFGMTIVVASQLMMHKRSSGWHKTENSSSYLGFCAVASAISSNRALKLLRIICLNKNCNSFCHSKKIYYSRKYLALLNLIFLWTWWSLNSRRSMIHTLCLQGFFVYSTRHHDHIWNS